MNDIKESGLAYEIRKLEAKLTRKHNKALKALEDRILYLEGGLAQMGAWVASKQRAEAQARTEEQQEPTIQMHSEEGEVWIKNPRVVPVNIKVKLVDAVSDKRI